MAVTISNPFRVYIKLPGAGTFGFKEIGWNGTVVNDQGKAGPVIFGKHWVWAQNVAADGKFYQFGGDGGIGLTSGQTARFFRYNMRATPPVLDLYYPQYGETNKPYPRGFDQVHSLLRTTNQKLYLSGGFYDNQVQVQDHRPVSVTVPALSSVTEIFEFDSYLNQTWKGWELLAGGPTAIPSASLPAGVLWDYRAAQFPGARSGFDQSVFPIILQVNTIGNTAGHGDDHALIGFYLYNTNATATFVPATTFTCTVAGFTFTGQPAQLPATIPAAGTAGWLWCELPVPSFNQDPNKWYVPPTVTDTKVGAVPTFPTGITPTVVTTKINPKGNVPTGASPSVYPYGSERARMQVTLTNTTASAIVVSSEVYVSSGRIGGDYPPSEAGAPGKGGTWNFTMGSPGTWVKTSDTDAPIAGWGGGNESPAWAYDTDLDCGWWVSPLSLVHWNLDTATPTPTVYTIPDPGNTIFRGFSWCARLQQTYCPETKEVMVLAPPNVNQTTPTYLVGVSTAAATRGQARIVATLPVFGQGADMGGMLPLVLVPSRHLIVLFTPEQIDYFNSTGQYLNGPLNPGGAQAGFPVKYGGIFLINYMTGAVERYDYPTDTSIVDAAVTDYGQVMVINAGYDSVIDKVWGTVKNNRKILHWGWS